MQSETISQPKAQEKLRIRKMRIVEAAVISFLEKGYHQTGVRDIAAKADISLGNFYNHFKSKDDVLLAITQIERDELCEFQVILMEKGTPEQVLELFIWAYLEYSARVENALMGLEILSVAVRTPSIADGFSQNRDILVSALIGTLDAGSRSGEFTPISDSEATALMLLDMIEGLALRSVLAETTPSETEKQILWQMIKQSIIIAS